MGLSHLHANKILHGKLTCESIYINSNTGEVKIGDLGLRTLQNMKSKLLSSNKIYLLEIADQSTHDIIKREDRTEKLDVLCFGLSLLEMITSDLQGHCAFRVLCKLINKGQMLKILQTIENPILSDFIYCSLKEN